jgi:hypothetical protein
MKFGRRLRDKANRIWTDPRVYRFPGQAYATEGEWMLPVSALTVRWVWGVRRLTCLCGHTTKAFDPFRIRIDLFVCPSCGCHYSSKVANDVEFETRLADVAPMSVIHGTSRDDEEGES